MVELESKKSKNKTKVEMKSRNSAEEIMYEEIGEKLGDCNPRVRHVSSTFGFPVPSVKIYAVNKSGLTWSCTGTNPTLRLKKNVW